MSNDDARTFRRAMQDVKRLPAAPSAPAAPKPRARASYSRQSQAAPPWEDVRRPYDSRAPEGGDVVAYRRPGVREDALRRLRRGQVPIEAEIDLHGLTRPAARDALSRFLGLALARRLHCVRVIHGKGLRSGHGGPVLKHSVIDWLSHFEQVLAFASARPAEGGSGALQVLLKVDGGMRSRS